ncbi:MAG: type I restriction enzyme HsdR N-terminal domain-containing protein [Fibrobacteria bacterium]
MNGGKTGPGPGATVFDPVRKRHVAATPEEGVRQAVLRYLLDVLRVPANLIGVEFCLASLEPGNQRRVDIVVWRPGEGQLAPWLLVECKEPRVRINDEVAFQAADYLIRVPCRYVMLSNGADTRYLEKADGRYRLVAALPFFRTALLRP